ncbi:tail protein [Vibrio phage CKB-S1]|nr:tail protein [Vibrio phage CKB-S1]
MAAPSTPTTQRVSENIVDQISAQLGQRAPILPKAFTRVMARALAGVVVTLYKYAGAIFLQMFVRTASNSPIVLNGRTVNPLAMWGELSGEEPQRLAVQAQLAINVAVITQGGILPSGSQLRGTNGVTYITTGDTLLNAATVSVTVTAAGDQQGGDAAGTIGNLTAGAELTFVQPLAAVQPVATVTAQTRTGADAETTEAFRTRILRRFQRRPQGGALADYPLWAETSTAVLNAYPYTGATPGTVDVYIESTTEEDGIPTDGQLAQALNAIQFDDRGLATRAPLGTFVNTLAITREEFGVEVTGLNVDNPTRVRSQIQAAMEEYFLGREPFLPGLSTGVRRNTINQSEVGGVVAGIVAAAGGTFTSVAVTNEADQPVVTRILPQGAKAKLDGDVTYA